MVVAGRVDKCGEGSLLSSRTLIDSRKANVRPSRARSRGNEHRMPSHDMTPRDGSTT